MIDYSDIGVVWYAMQTTYKRELKAKALLDDREIDNFIPMKQEVSISKGRKKITLRPAIHNLIFVKADIHTITELKDKINFLHNILTEGEKSLKPIVVPTKDMEQFIDATALSLEKVLYIDLTEVQLDKGTRVRITGGDFEGYQGVLAKVKGIRERRVVLNIEGLIAIALTTIDIDLIEKI